MSELNNKTQETKTLGILSIVFGILFSIVGLILGIVGYNKYQEIENKKLAKIGIIVSIIVMVASVIYMVVKMTAGGIQPLAR